MSGGIGLDEPGDAATTKPAVPFDKLVHFSKHLLDTTSDDMNIDGSTTPVVFEIGPGAGETWYIFELGVSIDDMGNNTLDTFGAIVGGLTNGVLIEQQVDSVDYEFETLKTNLDIVESFTDHFIRGQANAYINSSNFFAGKVELRDPVTLIGDDGDVIKATVSDDITGLTLLHMTVEGFKVI